MDHPSPADLPPSQSTSEAVNSIQELRVLLQSFIERNSELYDRVRELENGSQPQRQLSSIRSSIRSWTPSRITFEKVLSNSRIYRRALQRASLQGASSQPGSTGWSVMSGLSLSDISNLSVFHLAISLLDLSNPECYIILDDSSSIVTSRGPEESPVIATTETRSFKGLSPTDMYSADGVATPVGLNYSSGDVHRVNALPASGLDAEQLDPEELITSTTREAGEWSTTYVHSTGEVGGWALILGLQLSRQWFEC